MSSFSTIFAALLSITCLSQPVTAGLFLAKLSEPELRRVLLAEIESAIGSNLKDVPEKRIAELEAALRPTFDVLSKNGEGKLDHEGVRYLLKRVFVQQHGWFINGLQSDSQTWNSSSHAGVKDHLPELVQDLFEKRVGDRGSDLREVVALAATIEHLIRDELRGKLETVYEAKHIGVQEAVTTDQAINVMEFYMMLFLRGQSDLSGWTSSTIERLEKNFHRQYKAWDELKQVITEAASDTRAGTHSSHSFDDVAGMLETVANRFTAFYETQCTDMKSALLDIEDRRSGRVRLVDFYKAALEDGMYQFTESIDVLRDYGVLDEVDPMTPRIIIANYIGGHSNCVARTSFYSTCCPNTCESLLNNIERSLGKSEATPAELDSPHLSAWLRHRLDDLAQHHGGKIPLHGRLFSQWMHFAHPRDCTYPHVSGSISKIPYSEWKSETGKTHALTQSEMEVHALDLSQKADAGTEQHEHIRMWTMDEELFVGSSKSGEKADGSAWSAKALLYLVAALALFGGVVVMKSATPDGSKQWATERKVALDKYV